MTDVVRGRTLAAGGRRSSSGAPRPREVAEDEGPPAGRRPPGRSQALADEECAAWAVLAGILAALPPALEAPLRRRGDVSLFEFQILDTLSDTSEVPMRLSTVATRTDASLSRLSRAIDRLQKRGYVQRLTDDTDGRFTLCRLTEEGSTLLERVAPVHAAELRRLVLDQLTDEEIRHMRSIGTRITTAARAARGREAT